MITSVPALGRDAELAALGALLEAAREGRGGALVVRGEPGVGKSLLLATVADGADDVTTTWRTAAPVTGWLEREVGPTLEIARGRGRGRRRLVRRRPLSPRAT
jgi:hypothetical protein